MVPAKQDLNDARPHRPFGVSLAIVFTALLFTIIPLLQVGELLLIRQRIYDSLMDSGIQPIGVGGEIEGVSDTTLIVRGIFAIIVFVIAVFAWRGRPAVSRLMLVLAVFLMTGLRFIEIVTNSLTQPDFQGGFTSFDSVFRVLSAGQFFASLVVLLYVAWYMNRGPARAFYRGYYLPEDTTNFN